MAVFADAARAAGPGAEGAAPSWRRARPCAPRLVRWFVTRCAARFARRATGPSAGRFPSRLAGRSPGRFPGPFPERFPERLARRFPGRFAPRRRRCPGFTLTELVATLAVAGVLAGVAVPGVAAVGGALAAGQGAQRLALVLRVAQARAQAHGCRVQVTVAADGRFEAREQGAEPYASGWLGAPVSSTYPGGCVEFHPRGWPCLPGASSPRAGHFDVGGVAGHEVVLQLGGCVRCR